MPYSALGPVSIALFGRLNVGSLKGAYPAVGAGCVGGVRDYVPQAPVYPFLWYELSERDESGLGMGLTVKRLELRLHVFSQFLGAAEEQRIMSEAIRLLQYQTPVVVGWQVPRIGPPQDLIPIAFSELNGVVLREFVALWDNVFAAELAA